GGAAALQLARHTNTGSHPQNSSHTERESHVHEIPGQLACRTLPLADDLVECGFGGIREAFLDGREHRPPKRSGVCTPRACSHGRGCARRCARSTCASSSANSWNPAVWPKAWCNSRTSVIRGGI